ncbi:52 kDa repressor of the inhibitor of the protein kinase-like [Metopolophium dirhodum]|uniref:52 kDa repressor of the inhibitor of the protein kinase-like n=1 Tax=Metopolophium dirhodum TaxID=44670 RepID=UPI0029900355|nr:52 kDa repressor of the inhibitor of the protein kinase-like [Metopolophium dirhodum]
MPQNEDDQSNSIHSTATEISNTRDIGNYVGFKFNKIKDDELYDILRDPWIPHENFIFPLISQGDKNRPFKLHWINEYPWLSYSQNLGGAFCRICVLFGSDEGGRSRVKLGKLVTIPLSLYKKAKENFKAHQNNDYHKNCVFKSDNFISVMNGKIQNIETTLDTTMTRKVEQNRQKLILIIETLLFCGLQNISLRGHRDDGSINSVDDDIKNQKGNFKALLEFCINAGDQILKDILADETTDVSISEQFSFCVRYFDSDTCSIREHFLGFTKVEHVTGEYLADTIIQILKEKNLDLALLRGQGYDGAANMSGAFKGVQSRIASLQPLAFYTHCANHRLNLVLKLFPHQKAVKAKKLCETRWVERHDGILHFLEILPVIIVTLDELSLSNHTGSNAQSLSAAISITLPLSMLLQSINIDYTQSIEMINNVKNVLTTIRENSKTEFKNIFEETRIIAVKIDVDIRIPRVTKKQCHRANAQPESTDLSEFYHVNYFLSYLDYLMSELNSHDKILNAAKTYEADLPHSIEALRGELNLWKQFWKNKPEKADSSMEAFKYASMFPNIKCLLTILSVIPITTASAERSFSSLKRIKTYLRSTMSQERFNGLAMLHINKDIQVKPGEVLDVFAKKHKRKLQFDL